MEGVSFLSRGMPGMLVAFIHGVILALGLILPLGAQNVFVFNQGATQKHYLKAMPVVMTAAVCDTILILLAVLGVSLIVLTVSWLQTTLFALGFVFLLYMGWVVFQSNPTNIRNNHSRMSIKKQILFALSVSLLNPHAILDTIGVIGTNSLSYSGNEKIMFTLACILVSWIWFVGLSVLGRVVGRLDPQGTFIHYINRVAALIIWGVAIYIGIQLYDLIL